MILIQDVYVEANMEKISMFISIDISSNPNVMENTTIRVNCFPEEITPHTSLFKELCDFFAWSYE
jgi:hypothetical protein